MSQQIVLDPRSLIIRESLVEIARAQGITNYSAQGRLVGLSMDSPDDRSMIASLLDEINQYEAQRHAPMLSALVIRADKNMPGEGFFSCAIGLGKSIGDSELLFWINEVKEVHKYWQSH